MTDITVSFPTHSTRLRRVERRGKSARHDIDVMHADIVQLRQHVTEINTRIDGLDDLSSDLQLEVTKMTTDQRRLQEEAVKLRRSRERADGRLDDLEQNVTQLASRGDTADSQLRLAESSLREIHGSHRDVVRRLQRLDVSLHRLDRQSVPRDSAPSHRRRILKDSPSDTHSEVQPRDIHDDVNRQRLQRDRNQRAADGAQKAAGDQDFLGTSEDEVDISGDGDGDASLDVGSGDEGEFFIVDERYIHAGSGEAEVGVHGDADSGGTETDWWSVAPTPLTTNIVPTLTQAYVTAPTAPSTPCPSADEFNQLRQRLTDLETRLNTSLPAQDVLNEVLNETERLEAAASRRDEALGHVQGQVAELGGSVSRLTGQLASLRLAEFMERLQASLLNFTANVLTLDQWQLASQQVPVGMGGEGGVPGGGDSRQMVVVDGRGCSCTGRKLRFSHSTTLFKLEQ